MNLKPTLLLFTAALLVGCTGGGKTSGPAQAGGESAAASTSGNFKVALVTPGPVSDAGWSAMAYDGLKGIETSLGAKVANSEAQGTKIKDALRSYAQDGYKLVIGHGFEYNEPAAEVAKDFPNTVFLTSSGGRTAPNVGAFRFYLEQGFYVAGTMAGLMTKSGKVAMVGLTNIPSIASTFMAFEDGAKATRPGVKVLTVSLSDDKDVAAAKLATLKAIDAGADLIIHQANAAAQGVFDAAKERGVLAFGANLNQNDNPSGAVVASAIIIAKPAFESVAKKVKDGTYKGEVTLVGMKEGAIDFIFNPAMEAKIPANVKKEVEAQLKSIKDGVTIVRKAEF